MDIQPHPDQVKAGKIVSKAIKLGKELCKYGIEAEQLDKEIEQFIRDADATPGLKGYHPTFGHEPYPSTICLSLNNEVVHGLPKNKFVGPDDLITIDLVVKVGDYYCDAARTFTYSEDQNKLDFLSKCESIFNVTMLYIRPKSAGLLLGGGIENMAKSHGLSIVEEFCGHGIGREIHEEPQVYNHTDYGQRWTFEPGRSYAIEPIIAKSAYQLEKMPDGWTYRANCLTTHFENTVWIGDNECIILTEESYG